MLFMAYGNVKRKILDMVWHTMFPFLFVSKNKNCNMKKKFKHNNLVLIWAQWKDPHSPMYVVLIKDQEAHMASRD